MELKQSTAVTVMMLAVDSTDHTTAETGLTLALSASKSGSAFSAITPTITEVSNGWYAIQLTTVHTDTLGDLVLRVTNAGAEGERMLSVVANVVSDTFTRIGAPTGASIAADVAAVKTDTGAIATETNSHPTLAEIEASTVLAKQATVAAIPTTPLLAANYIAPDNAGIAAIPTNPLLSVDARLNSLDAAISSRLATAGYTAPDNASITGIKAKTDLITAAPATQAALDALLTTAMTESYSADGSAPTPAQALMMILQMLSEKSVSGTTMTIKKLNGSSTAMTFTLDSATVPTAITRAS